MKILLVHNYYGSDAPSGENQVVALEHQMLVSRGHEVRVFERHSDEIRAQGVRGLVKGALATPWNPFSARKMRETMQAFQPDVVHAHNTFPLISPAVFSAATGAARVLTLHNYRLFCPAGIPLRNGIVCTECIDKKSTRPAMRHECYRGSRLATIPLAANVTLQRIRRTWQRDVDAFITLTDFQRDLMTTAGLPAEKVFVKPNFYPGEPKIIPWKDRTNQVVFVGRLSVEKGVNDLINAWLDWGSSAPDLVLVGDGPDRTALEAQCKGAANIRFLGQAPSVETQKQIARARLLVFPSRWFETFGLVLLEALALSTPVLVSDLGSLPGLVAPVNGAVFRAGDATDLRQKTQTLLADENRLSTMSNACHEVFEKNYTEEINYRILMNIYQAALARTRTKRG